jgi:hypothetical protein
MVSITVNPVAGADSAEQLGSFKSVYRTVHQLASTRNVGTRYQAHEGFRAETKGKAGSFQRKFVR